MDEFDLFRAHISKRIDLSDGELDQMVAAFQLKKVRKRQMIIQPDFVARHRSYVVNGVLRSYVVDQAGMDHTIQFAVDDWWISDLNSYIYRQPATLFVAALEDSTLFQIEYDVEQQLKLSNHKFETFFRIGAERTAAYHQRRIISTLTQTAEERYNAFLETYPDVAQRLPQYAVASYLGMTTQFLSQIRNNKLKKKLK